MILYHGTTAYFDVVDLSNSRNRLDFGVGFYTTSDINQARKIALDSRNMNLALDINTKAYVYSFKFDGSLSKFLNVHRFSNISTAWVDYVLYNRTLLNTFRTSDYSGFDVLVGKVADNKIRNVIDAFIVKGDFSDKAKRDLSNNLKPNNFTDQYVFKSIKAIYFLNNCCSIQRREVF